MMEARLEKFIHVTNTVYGASSRSAPLRYRDNKSRYLWTDAFGVCNYVTLYRETKDTEWLQRADALICDVHDVLGKDRKAERRLGNSTDEHPTLAGLRIGKADPEGSPDGDGQYFHYLTKWAFALNQMSKVRQDAKYNRWAIELIKGIHNKFTYGLETNRPRMYWKMSIDLSHPLVSSEGNLDPYDGLITYRLVNAESSSSSSVDPLAKEIADLERMVHGKYKSFATDDPLDLGEALWISHWFPEEEWSKVLAARSIAALEHLYAAGYFHMRPRSRLAFREFGTTIGLQLSPYGNATEWRDRVKALNEFWAPHIFERDSDITPVMFCTSLIPGAFGKGYL